MVVMTGSTALEMVSRCHHNDLFKKKIKKRILWNFIVLVREAQFNNDMTEYYTIFLPYSPVLSLNTSRFKRPTLICLGMALVPIVIKE